MSFVRAYRGRGLAVVLVALALLVPGIARAQSPEIMPVSQVKIGMKGYGLTVFKGTRIEKFDVEVLGVLAKQNLGGDLILVRMKGGPITERGANIIGGMSGSPVYINGKLVGAVSYGMVFPKEPLAMLTPAQDMLEALDPRLDKEPPTPQASVYDLEKPIRVGDRTIHRIALGKSSDSTPASAGDTLGMIPLATPVMVAGVSPRSMRYLSGIFENAQIEPMAGPGTATNIKSKIPLLPGSAVGVQLMRGDIDMTGIGTLTYRKGNRVLAFGHPMLGVGTVDMPMTTGYIYDIFCSVQRSFKMGAPVQTVGSINQDRPWAVAGTVGKMPRMVPVTIQVRNLANGRSKTLNVEVINDPFITFSLILTAASEGIQRVHPNVTDAMAKVKFEVCSESFPSIVRENTYFDPMTIDAAALRDLMTVLAMLTMNPTQPERIKKVNVTVEIWDKRQTATVQRIFLKKSKFEPGETVDVGVVLKPYKQDEIVKTLSIKIPETAANGSVSLTVSGGGLGIQPEGPPAGQPAGAAPAPTVVVGPASGPGMDLKEMVKRFLEREKNNDLVAKLTLSSPGVNIKGEKLLGLPANMAEVFRSPKATGIRAEREEIKTVDPTDWVITGAQTLSLTIQRKAKAEKSSGSKSDTSTTTSTTSSSAESIGTTVDPGEEDFGAQAGYMLPQPAIIPQNGDNGKTEEKKDTTTTEAKKEEPRKEEAKTDEKKTETKPAETTTEVKPAVKTVVRQASRWVNSSQADFEQGTGTGAAATSAGDVRLTRTFKLAYDSPEPYIWTLAVGKDGIYAGTGNDGRIYRIGPNGEARLYAETGGLEVQTIAIGKDGTLYAGTAPDSIIYKIGPDGKPVKLYNAEERYIPAMVTDADGNLYAATSGGIARIYKIAPDGTASVFFSTPETHILSLVMGSDGSLYAGTGENGIVYKIDKSGRGQVLYDAGESNITALTLDTKGNVYAGTGTKGVLYRIAPDGTVKKLTDKFKATVTALAMDSAGNVLASSGSQVFAIAPDETVTTFDEIPGAQLLCMAVDPAGSVYAGTGNTGQIYKSGIEENQGTYESSTHDAGSIARWGHINWTSEAPQGTSVTLQIRSGNTAEPDSTWSAWSSVASGGSISSPAARFIQYRAVLKADRADKTPKLRDVVISYLPKNQAPTVTISAPAANTYWSKKQLIKWTATDPDKDTVSAEVFSSADNGASWVSLAKVDKESTYSWDTSQVPDGTYLIKVVVSDRKSNGDGALTAEKISDPVVVVNKAPVLTIYGDKTRLAMGADKTVTVKGHATSALAPVVGVEWQVNGNGWSAAASTDGIYDSDDEEYSFTTDPLATGDNNLEIKVTDAAGNTTTEKLTVKVP